MKLNIRHLSLGKYGDVDESVVNSEGSSHMPASTSNDVA